MQRQSFGFRLGVGVSLKRSALAIVEGQKLDLALNLRHINGATLHTVDRYAC